MNLYSILGGRKMAIALGMVSVGVGAVLYTGDVPAGLLDLLKYTGGFLIGGNVVSKFAGPLRKAPVQKEQSAPASPELAKIVESQQALGEGITVIQDSLSYIIGRINGQPGGQAK